MKRKAQITVFIVLGVVIFAVMGLLLYITMYAKTKELTQEKEELKDLFTTQGKYAGYMQSCLDLVTMQGIALLGMQGGVIYEYQAKGTKPFLGPRKYDYGQYVFPLEWSDDFDLFSGADTVIFNISYGISAPDLSLKLEGHPTVPDYPYGKVKLIEDPTQFGSTYSNVFGNVLKDPLPPLCDYYGTNSPLQQGAMQRGAVASCESYDSQRESDNDNIQEYLEAYIAQTFEDCVALESLPEFQNTSIRAGNITVTVTFSPTAVTVKADYPLVATIEGTQATLSLQTFYTTANVRLKQIHELVTRVIENDVNNIFFNIVRDANTLIDCKELGKETDTVRCLKEGMTVTKLRDVCQKTGLCKKYGQYDDVVMIQDEQSLLNGKSFLFVFAIQNRYPALDIIYQYNENCADDFYSDYDVVVERNAQDMIEIDPYGYDPDEDYHGDKDFMESRYIYGAWKEDYDESFGIREVKVLEDRFSTSEIFTTTQRQATYMPSEADIGPHILQIQVCDNEGLCDFQNVDIYVTNTC